MVVLDETTVRREILKMLVLGVAVAVLEQIKLQFRGHHGGQPVGRQAVDLGF